MDGKLMHIQDKPGITQWLISWVKPHQCNSGVKDWNQMSLNGSDLNKRVVVHHQDFSIMRFLNQHGSDIKAILTTQKKFSTHSQKPIKNNKSCLVLIQLQKKEEKNSRQNGMLFENLPLKLSKRMIWYILTKWEPIFQRKLTSKESGDIIKNIL